MDKTEWTYKTIREVCVPKKEILRAGKYFDVNDEILYIDISSIDNKSQIITETTRYLMSDAPSRAQQCVQCGDILVSTVRPNLKNIAIVNEDKDNLVASSGFCVLRSRIIERNYLFYYLKSDIFTSHLMGLTTGANYPAVKDSDVLDSIIPFPPKSTQQQIIKELNAISQSITMLQQQVNDLDSLSQSIFYDMFGDPRCNDYNWPTESFKKMFILKSGDGLSAKNFVEGEIPVYGGNGISGYHNVYNKNGNYIIIGRVGAYCGNVRKVFGKFWLTDNAFELQYSEEIFNDTFLSLMLSFINLNSYANHAAQPVISNVVLKDISIPIPPLSIQQSFSSKISAIEELKSVYNSQISEMQTLLASRMQYWFE